VKTSWQVVRCNLTLVRFSVTFRGVDYIDLDCHRSASQAKKSKIIHEEAGTAVDSIYRQVILNVFSVLM